MSNTYLVATGVRSVRIEAENPALAIQALKERIRARGADRPPLSLRRDIGMSLVTALAEERLNFVVMTEDRSQLLAGEMNGNYEEPVSRALANSLKDVIPPRLYFTTRDQVAAE